MSDATPNALVEVPNEKAFAKDDGPANCRTRLIVGDDKEPSVFYPQFKSEHWDNECNFSVRLTGVDYAKGTYRQTAQGIEWIGENVVVRFYETTAAKHERGGFEFEAEYASKPASNVIPFTIRSKGFVFCYQGPLTAQEIARGCVRPDDVVGSYAVYHATQKHNFVGGKNYATGKAFHIYRPWAQDAKATRVWCELKIDAVAETMSVTVPQDFLDSAVYPVIVDPTYGYTANGATEDGTDGDAVAYNNGSFGGTNNSTIASANWYGRKESGAAAAQNVGVGLYSDGTSVPVTLLGSVTASVLLSTTATSFALTGTDAFALQNGTTYWLGAACNFGSGWKNFYDAAGTDSSFDDTRTTLPAPWVETGATGARLMSFYFNLTSGSSGPTEDYWAPFPAAPFDPSLLIFG